MRYENTRGGMADILSHDNISSHKAPPRAGGGMADILGGGGEQPHHAPRAQAQPTRTAMSDVMQGVGALGIDDSVHGLGRRTLNTKHAGTGALAALRGEEAEAGMDDPFGQQRFKPKLHPRDAGSQVQVPLGGIPGTEDAAERAARHALEEQQRSAKDAEDPVFAQLKAVHMELVELAASLPRENPDDPRMPRGRLTDYKALLHLLAARGITLNADAAGTLIATIDVEGTCSFEAFMECVAMGLRSADQEGEARGMASGATPPVPAPAECVVRARGGPRQPLDSAGWALGQPPPKPPPAAVDPFDALRVKRERVQDVATANVREMLGAGGIAGAGTNASLAQLLNGGAQQHGHAHNNRRGEIGVTVGKSSQFR